MAQLLVYDFYDQKFPLIRAQIPLSVCRNRLRLYLGANILILTGQRCLLYDAAHTYIGHWAQFRF